MPILGTIASSKLTAAAGDFESIASTVVGAGGASEITFSGIPATYQHLQLRYFAPSTQSTSTSWSLYVGNGGISTSGYTYHDIYAYGNPVQGATTRPNESLIELHFIPGGISTPVAGIVDILDYANTNKNKSIRALSGHVDTSSGNGSQNWVTGGAWLNNSAITHIRFQYGTGSNTMPQYTRASLYGIKG
jgi:hypothetical protein